MNSAIPIWWLILTGIFAVTNILFFLIVLLLAAKMMKQLQLLMPKLEETVNNLNETIDKVSLVADNVNAITISAKETFDEVGKKTKNVASSAESIAGYAAGQISGIGPVIKYGMIAFKVIQAFRSVTGKKSKHSGQQKDLPALPKH